MQIFKFITIDGDKKACWCTTNDPKMFVEFSQYILESNSPDDFVVLDMDNEKAYKFIDIANTYGMRKRTFEERMNNVITGHLMDAYKVG